LSGARKVYGVGPVRELIRAGGRSIHVLYVAPSRAQRPAGDRGGSGGASGGDAVAQLAAEAKQRGIAVEERSRPELDALVDASARHQGVVAVTGEYAYADLDDLLAVAQRRDEQPLLVALDGVQDPHNLGAVVRSAYLLGAHGVIVPEHRAAVVTPAVTKASAGATELVGIALVKNLARALATLKEAGVWIAAVASAPEARPLHELDGKTPLCLVLGAEGTGVRHLVSRSSDFHVEIPMSGKGVGSLNVSVAAGIALYEVSRQRRG
jgi:23S rRNA (guanosine2251-2'-O)-methyltransferase